MLWGICAREEGAVTPPPEWGIAGRSGRRCLAGKHLLMEARSLP